MGDQETYDITRLIRQLHQDQKLSIVLIEHDMRVIFHLADRIMVLAEGAMLAEGTPQEIAANEARAGRLSGEGGMSGSCSRPRASTPSTARATSCTASASTVREGEIVTLLGRNGAGKTTTLRSLVGLTPPREGMVRDLRPGHDRLGRPIAIAALGVGYVPEGRRIFANLTVEENLKVPLERPGPWTIAAHLRALPAPGASGAATRAASSPAASRRCWRSPARCCSIRSCCCSTSRRRAWRR